MSDLDRTSRTLAIVCAMLAQYARLSGGVDRAATFQAIAQEQARLALGGRK